jgi:hypothetical protein
MKRSQIADLQSSLQRARGQLQHCRNERLIFEQQMDVNSCDDHRVLGRLYNDENKLNCELKLIEQKLLNARPSYNLLLIFIICLTIATLLAAYLYPR